MSALSAAVLAATLAGPAAAAPARVPDLKPQAAPTYWLEIYSTSPYREFWTAELSVGDLDKAVPKVVDAIAAEGGGLVQPLADFASSRRDQTQQLSFSVPKKSAAALVARLRRLGAMPDPLVRAEGAPIPLAEVRAKIDKLMKEKVDHAADLAKVPASAAVAEELLEHLLLVEAVAERPGPQVRFDLLVRGR